MTDVRRGGPYRCEIEGKPAIAGKCQGCDLEYIVTDPASDGSRSTYHGEPMCQWYLELCKGAIPLDEGPKDRWLEPMKKGGI